MRVAVQTLINLFIAILWMFFQDDWSVVTLFRGYLVGIGILFAFRRVFPAPFYLKTIYSVAKLVLIFMRELVVSALLVTKQVIQPTLKITPGVFALETTLEKEWEVVLLALLLTLTPGSTVIEISPKRDVLYLHAMDIPESRDAVIRTTGTFEKAIRGVSE